MRSGTAMIHGKKLVVIMPAYNAEKTLRKTYEELPHEYVDEVILVVSSMTRHATTRRGSLRNWG